MWTEAKEQAAKIQLAINRATESEPHKRHVEDAGLFLVGHN
eukprot:SAG11_NODE_11238_length_774_cov_1.280000_2_plen_40_part_01